MQDSRRGSTLRRRRRRLLNALVVGEVAIAFVLVCGSALLVRSFVGLIHVDTGFAVDNVLTMSLPVPGFPPGSGYASPDQFTAYVRDLVAAVDAVPGVRRAAITNALPLTDCCLNILNLQIANRPIADRADRGGGFFKVVTPSYFATLGLTLRKGRFLDERDIAGGVPAVVINQRLADRYFPGEDPIGRHILNPRIVPGRTERGADVSWEIVGVVANEKISALNEDGDAVLYASYEQSPVYFSNLVVRTGVPAEAIGQAVQQAVNRVNKAQGVMDLRTLEQIRTRSTASGRLQTVLMSGFSAVAVALAAIGLYGVLAYSVALRVREIGIRAALGASSSRLLGAVLSQGLAVTGLGLAIGVAAALVLTPLLRAVLYNVEPHDGYLMSAAVTILVLVSLVACAIPARRAAKIDPIVALRGE
jgi:putative ABC transport system permease protein